MKEHLPSFRLFFLPRLSFSNTAVFRLNPKFSPFHSVGLKFYNLLNRLLFKLNFSYTVSFILIALYVICLLHSAFSVCFRKIKPLLPYFFSPCFLSFSCLFNSILRYRSRYPVSIYLKILYINCY